MTKKATRTHARNPLYFMLKLYLGVRNREFYCPSLVRQFLFGFLRWNIGIACYVFSFISGINPRFRWFNNRSSRQADRKRNELIRKLDGRIRSTAGGSKLYTGSLSPGCLHCIEGDWACNFINRLCNRDCFFCKRSHSLVREELEPETWGFFFPDPTAHLNYLRTFHIKGVSFSGGEPLLVKERLLHHMAAVRDELGDSVYIWMYTNGDLLDSSALEELRNAGLDEIRINIAASEYDLSPARMAREYIRTVTVEIPCIPEDHQKLKALLPEIRKAGVDFLNIHQLSVEEQNCRELMRHKYHFTGDYPGITVYESEICALKLLLHAVENGIDLPVNYCTSPYKHRFQGRGYRKQRASAFPRAFEELTATGHLRRLSVSSSSRQIHELVSKLHENSIDSRLWNLEEDEASISLHSSLLQKIEWPGSDVTITYFKPGVAPGEGSSRLNAGNLKPDNKIVFRGPGLNQPLMDLWGRLYIAGEDQESALRDFYSRRDPQDPMLKNPDVVLRMSEYEIQKQGFPKIV